MKKWQIWTVNLMCLFLFGGSPAFAQQPEAAGEATVASQETQDGIQERGVQTRVSLAEFYRAREQQAPPAVQQRLQALRAEIQSKNLRITVGYTSVSDLPLETITGFIPPTPEKFRMPSFDSARWRRSSPNETDSSKSRCRPGA